MQIKENIGLAKFTTLGVGGPAHYFCSVTSTDELKEALNFAYKKNLPIFVLGEGSNVLISDEGFQGLAIYMCIKGISFNDRNGDVVTVTVYAGENWDDFVLETVKKGLWGVENMSGIPGGVGAAVVGNIAAYGEAVSDTLESIDVIDTTNGKLQTLQSNELGLKYRYSDFQNSKLESKIIVSAIFILSKSKTAELEYESALIVANETNLDPNNIKERREIILESRKRKGSLLAMGETSGTRTAGSFFKNPEVSQNVVGELINNEEFGVSEKGALKQSLIHTGSTTRVPAAYVLLAAGFERGQEWGNVRLHPDHILKLQNIGNATAQEIHNVVQEIVITVQNKLNIKLKPEVRFVGNFK